MTPMFHAVIMLLTEIPHVNDLLEHERYRVSGGSNSPPDAASKLSSDFLVSSGLLAMQQHCLGL